MFSLKCVFVPLQDSCTCPWVSTSITSITALLRGALHNLSTKSMRRQAASLQSQQTLSLPKLTCTVQIQNQNLQHLDIALHPHPPTALPGEDVAVPAEGPHTGRMAGHISEALLLLDVPHLDRQSMKFSRG